MSHETAIPGAPRPASSLILLRNTDAGPQVLLLKRHGMSDVLGGAFVFPGGKLDVADTRLDAPAHLDQVPTAMHASLAEPGLDVPTAVGLFVAAVREAYEECGILLAHGVTASLCREATARSRAGLGFNELLAALDLRLRTSELAPWSRWITPPGTGLPRRFDTRFFVAAAPLDAQAYHDGHETTEAVWLRPRQALERNWAGEIDLAPPQIMTLAHLSRHANVASVLAEARGRGPALVQPEVLMLGESRTLCYPGDEDHPVPDRAMPGPLRLTACNGRYEPELGFEAFFN